MKNINVVVGEFEEKEFVLPTLEQDTNVSVLVKKGGTLTFSVLAKNNIQGSSINILLEENSEINAYFADFSREKEKISINIETAGEGAKCYWHLASLASKNDNKEFEVSIKHTAKNTYAKMDNFGVCKDDAKLIFSGVSSIEKGNSGTKTHQNAKIMVFDKLSNAIAKPILKIDENDIEASHAAVVGKINDEHLFYLTSRGIPEATAKELITYGYLKPILKGFSNEALKEEISNLVEGRM